MFSQSKRNNKALKRRVALAIPAIALFHATGANAQGMFQPLDVVFICRLHVLVPDA